MRDAKGYRDWKLFFASSNNVHDCVIFFCNPRPRIAIYPALWVHKVREGAAEEWEKQGVTDTKKTAT